MVTAHDGTNSSEEDEEFFPTDMMNDEEQTTDTVQYSQEEFVCPVCLLDIEVGGGIVINNCHHQICKQYFIQVVDIGGGGGGISLWRHCMLRSLIIWSAIILFGHSLI